MRGYDIGNGRLVIGLIVLAMLSIACFALGGTLLNNGKSIGVLFLALGAFFMFGWLACGVFLRFPDIDFRD